MQTILRAQTCHFMLWLGLGVGWAVGPRFRPIIVLFVGVVYSCQKLPVPFSQHPGLCRELL